VRVVAGVPEDKFDPHRALWTGAGCLITVLVWAAIIGACAAIIRG
jgi:hypothetical protein